MALGRGERVQTAELSDSLWAAVMAVPPSQRAAHVWAAGDACSAPWREDGRFYPARVQAVLADGRCRGEFLGYGNVETLAPGALRRNASQ